MYSGVDNSGEVERFQHRYQGVVFVGDWFGIDSVLDCEVVDSPVTQQRLGVESRIAGDFQFAIGHLTPRNDCSGNKKHHQKNQTTFSSFSHPGLLSFRILELDLSMRNLDSGTAVEIWRSAWFAALCCYGASSRLTNRPAISRPKTRNRQPIIAIMLIAASNRPKDKTFRRRCEARYRYQPQRSLRHTRPPFANKGRVV